MRRNENEKKHKEQEEYAKESLKILRKMREK